MTRPSTLGQLRSAGYRPCRVKDEIRRNLRLLLQQGKSLFPGLVGYDDTVLPEVVHALLARHDLLLLGTRGQGKTRLLRQLPLLLDEAIPFVAGSELRDDPLAPVSVYARRQIQLHGDQTPIDWLPREERYLEKLATPDVTMADLFGDIDLMKHVQGRSLADEEALHFGLIPRANRGIFCINELPDLSPRIQVGLFNLLQERDVQIRGFPVRFSLDVCLVFSANPEDYTNRGRIVTPLKDRIGSVVRTHYPRTRAEGVAITDGSAWTQREELEIILPTFLKEIIEELARRARVHPSINQASGISARLGIAACELLAGAAEYRALVLSEPLAVPRISDLPAVVAGTRGKLEWLLTDEEAEDDRLIQDLLREAIRAVFSDHVRLETVRDVREWFQKGGSLTVGDRLASTHIVDQATTVPGLISTARMLLEPTKDDPALLASGIEFVLEGLHLAGMIAKQHHPHQASYANKA